MRSIIRPGIVVLAIASTWILTAGVDAGSDNPEKVRDWMKQRNYDFPVLLDDGYVNRMGIHAFPTTWFVDSRGRKAFILVDWSKWLVEEYGWRIEALKNEGS